MIESFRRIFNKFERSLGMESGTAEQLLAADVERARENIGCAPFFSSKPHPDFLFYNLPLFPLPVKK